MKNKKWTNIFMAMLIASALTACGEKEDTDISVSLEQEETEELPTESSEEPGTEMAAEETAEAEVQVSITGANETGVLSGAEEIYDDEQEYISDSANHEWIDMTDESQTVEQDKPKRIILSEKDTKWKQTYLTYIQNGIFDENGNYYNPEEFLYGLIYLDSDRIPEIVAYNTNDAFENCTLLANRSESIISCMWDGQGFIWKYIPYSGKCLVSSAMCGCEYEKIYCLTDTEIKGLIGGGGPMIEDDSCLENAEQEYSWGDLTEIDCKTYLELREKDYPISDSVAPEFDMDYEEMIAYLSGTLDG